MYGSQTGVRLCPIVSLRRVGRRVDRNLCFLILRQVKTADHVICERIGVMSRLNNPNTALCNAIKEIEEADTITVRVSKLNRSSAVQLAYLSKTLTMYIHTRSNDS